MIDLLTRQMIGSEFYFAIYWDQLIYFHMWTLTILYIDDSLIDDEHSGDGAPALSQLSFQFGADYDVAKEIVSLFLSVGANLNVRHSQMYASETPLHIAATYGNISVVKALVEGGATVDISDDRGRTPFDNAKKGKSLGKSTGDVSACVAYLKEAYKKEKAGNGPSVNKSTAQLKRGEIIRKLADSYYISDDYENAAKEYTKLLGSCGDDAVVFANLAATNMKDAIDRLMRPGGTGYRQKFKDTYENAQKSVDLDPKYERGWYLLARGYLGFNELPRAKKACKEGYLQCPSSVALKSSWDVLHALGIPDEVADHSSEEWKAIQHKLYIQRWIGDVRCDCCGLLCMTHPIPKLCPFCNCPTSIDLSDDELVPMLTVSEEFLDMIDDVSNNNGLAKTCISAHNEGSASFSIGTSGDQGTRGSIKKRTNKKKKGKGKGKGKKK